MTNTELQQQYKRCQEWNDPEQWELLGVEYYRNGYKMNARRCFAKADELRGVAFAEAVPETLLLAEAQP